MSHLVLIILSIWSKIIVPIVTYILGTTIKERNKYFQDPSGYDLVKDKLIYLGEFVNFKNV